MSEINATAPEQATDEPGRKKQASGGARRMAAGKRLVSLTIGPEILEPIEQAARESGLYVTQFFITHTLAAAKKIIAKGG